MIDINDINRERDTLYERVGNVMRLLDAHRSGGVGYTPAVRRMHLAAAKNAVEAIAQSLEQVEAEVLPKPSAASRLPVTVSPAGAA